MSTSFSRLSLLIPLLLMLSAGCADYRFSVNERVVYNPDPVFTDYSIPDTGLRNCIRRYIEANKISSAAEVRELDCRNSDIIHLRGLQVFVSLAYLNLEGNPALACEDLKLPGVPGGTGIVVPKHCPAG